MERRKALILTAGIMGTALIGSELFLSGCKREQSNGQLLSGSDVDFLNEVGEVILPETTRSPGAKAANVGEFMKTMVRDCYDDKQRQIFVDGIDELNKMSKSEFGDAFIKIGPAQKHELLARLDKAVRKNQDTENPHFFKMMKELTLLGYFTSEPGATMALRYNPIPGKYVGCIPYKAGDKAWF